MDIFTSLFVLHFISTQPPAISAAFILGLCAAGLGIIRLAGMTDKADDFKSDRFLHKMMRVPFFLQITYLFSIPLLMAVPFALKDLLSGGTYHYPLVLLSISLGSALTTMVWLLPISVGIAGWRWCQKGFDWQAHWQLERASQVKPSATVVPLVTGAKYPGLKKRA